MSYISSTLSQLDILESEGKYLELSSTVLSMMMKGIDLTPLAGKIIKYLAVPYPPFKKVMYAFLVRYSASISDINILATNSLLKDFKDPNPFLRRLVIKTVCSIPCFSDLAFQLLPEALCDSSAYVRCCAASCCSLVLREETLESYPEIIHKLYEMIRDPDASVVTSSLASLDEILCSSGGIAMNSRMTQYILSRISEFGEWNFTIVHSVMKKYVPKNNDEIFMFLNVLDVNLMNSNPAVFPLAVDLALFYVSQLAENLSDDIIRQITPHLKFLLNHSSNETLECVLDIVESYLPRHNEIFLPFYETFFCLSNNTPNIKVKKLKLVIHFINASTASKIIEEILSHCCDATIEVASQAITSFIAVTRIHEGINIDDYMRSFVTLLDIQHNNLSEEVLSALSEIDLCKTAGMKDCVIAAISHHSSNISTTKGKLSLLKFIGKYGKEIPNAPYIIENILSEVKHEESDLLTSFLLTTTVKLFCIRPEEMQLLLGLVLQSLIDSSSLVIRRQASVYYYLLRDMSLAKKVFSSACTST